MSRHANFKQRLLNRDAMSGTFLKTPHYVLVEVLAQSGLDFICLDAEHAPFDRAAIDQCCAIARALDFPLLVRVAGPETKEILSAMDCGAVGVVIPHVDSVETAQAMAQAARFGLGGRGYAGSSRWAGYATRPMNEVMDQSRDETVVIAQIEEPYAVPLADQIAAIDGIDALFAGPADLSVGMGYRDQSSDDLKQALAHVGAAAQAAGKTYASWVATTQAMSDWHEKYGVNMFFVSSEHAWMRSAAKEIAQTAQAL